MTRRGYLACLLLAVVLAVGSVGLAAGWTVHAHTAWSGSVRSGTDQEGRGPGGFGPGGWGQHRPAGSGSQHRGPDRTGPSAAPSASPAA